MHDLRRLHQSDSLLGTSFGWSPVARQLLVLDAGGGASPTSAISGFQSGFPPFCCKIGENISYNVNANGSYLEQVFTTGSTYTHCGAFLSGVWLDNH